MGRVSQRHRQEVNGLDSSGRPPEAGSVVIEQARAFEIVEANGTTFSPAILSVQGDNFTGVETFEFDITPQGQLTAQVTVDAVAGSKFDQMGNLETEIETEGFPTTVVGGRLEIFASDPAQPILIDNLSLTLV